MLTEKKILLLVQYSYFLEILLLEEKIAKDVIMPV